MKTLMAMSDYKIFEFHLKNSNLHVRYIVPRGMKRFVMKPYCVITSVPLTRYCLKKGCDLFEVDIPKVPAKVKAFARGFGYKVEE